MIIAEARNEADMAAVRGLRAAVFIEEQKVPADLEWDGLDGAARHLLAREDGQPAGTLRWRQLGDVAKIERVCVAKPWRGRQLGAQLMEAVLEQIRATPGLRAAKLGAQVAVLGFYERFGFVAEGPVFDDAGIPHRMMRLVLAP